MTDIEKNVEQLLAGELEPLLLSALDRSASEAEIDALVASLRSSDELRKRTCRFHFVESLLSDQVGTTEKASRLVEKLSAENLHNIQTTLDSSSNPSRSFMRGMVRCKDFINHNGLAVAAMLLFVIIGLFVHNMSILSKMSRLHALNLRGSEEPTVEVAKSQPSTGSKSSRLSGSTKVVGHVIGLKEVQWQADQRELTFGDTLSEGQRLSLASGGLEILLANGAKITAEGPVDFEVTSLVTMGLDLGKVVAAVPRTARGYTILTPTTEIVDIGTQFGISVSESGETELHVFDGDVVARSLLDREESELVHARENEAIGFNSISAVPRNVEIRKGDFLRQLGPILAENELPPIPVTKNLSLWFSADMIGGVDEGEAVSVWRDTLIGENKFANDARQIDKYRSPSFVRDDNGRAALEFDGVSNHFLIDNLESNGSSTVFVVCSPSDTKKMDSFHGGFLFKQGIAPSLELSVLQDRSSRGWLWPGPNEDRVGVANGSAISRESPSFIAYKYDAGAKRSELWTNGILEAVSNAPQKLAPDAPACIGGYCDPSVSAYYSGRIYEVVVFDAALDAESMHTMGDYFASRYVIESAE